MKHVHTLSTGKHLSCAELHAHYGANILYSEIEKIIKVIFILNLYEQQDVGAISKN